MILAGEVALWVSLLLAAWGTLLSAVAARGARPALGDSGARAAIALPFALLLAAAGLVTALVGNDFSLRQAAEHSSLATPWPYRVAALWAGVGGSLLLWSIALAVHGALLALVLRARRAPPALRALAPAAVAVSSALVLALLVILLAGRYPYARLPWPVPDGAGLRPELRHPAMALHPPLLHFGYAALVAPFALAMAALGRNEPGDAWLPLARRWGTAAWTLLTAAILLGMRWALVTPGWDGVWQWEGVQLLALAAWLVATVLAHGDALARRWPRARLIVTWCAALGLPIALAGLTAAHAGALGGRHAFRDSPAEAPLVALVLIVGSTALMLAGWRARELFPAKSNEPESTGRSARRTNVGAWVAHAGMVLVIAGLAALGASREYRVALEPAQAVELTDPLGAVWRFTSQGESRGREGGEEVSSVALDVARNGKPAGLLMPSIREPSSPEGSVSGGPMPVIAMRESALMEVSVRLADYPTPVASLVVRFAPFGVWLWIGGLLAVIGGISAAVAGESVRRSG